MSKFALYRFIAPFRSRLQSRLREERLDVDADVFASQMEAGGRSGEIAHLLWGMLREEESALRTVMDCRIGGFSKEEAQRANEITQQILETRAAGLGDLRLKVAAAIEECDKGPEYTAAAIKLLISVTDDILHLSQRDQAQAKSSDKARS